MEAVGNGCSQQHCIEPRAMTLAGGLDEMERAAMEGIDGKGGRLGVHDLCISQPSVEDVAHGKFNAGLTALLQPALKFGEVAYLVL